MSLPPCEHCGRRFTPVNLGDGLVMCHFCGTHNRVVFELTDVVDDEGEPRPYLEE